MEESITPEIIHVERERPERRRYVPRAVFWIAGALAVALLAFGVYSLSAYLNRPVVLPSITGKTLTESETYLKQQGFVPGKVIRQPSARPRNEVVAQRPAAGSLVAEGSTVDIFVSSGDGRTVVPQIIGIGLPLALGRLESNGIRYEIDHVLSREASGTILSSDPVPGTEITFDRVVRIRVAMDAVSISSLLPFDMAGITVAIYPTDIVSSQRDIPLEIANRLQGLLEVSGATVVAGRTALSTPEEIAVDAVRSKLEGASPTLVVLLDVRGDAESGLLLDYSSIDASGTPSFSEKVAQACSSQLESVDIDVHPEPSEGDVYLSGSTSPWVRLTIGNFRFNEDVKRWTDVGFVDDIARSLYLSVALAAERDIDLD